jgi:hypothetical protein
VITKAVFPAFAGMAFQTGSQQGYPASGDE